MIARGGAGRRRFGIAALALALAGCVPMPPRPTAAAAPSFSPQGFFAGETVGDGVLRTVMTRARTVHVVGHGRVEPDGSLVLDQRVEVTGKPPHLRTWHLRTLADGRFAATLSDAVGPVAVDRQGSLLHVRFAMKGGLGVEQRIYLQSDGRTALNRMVVRKLGVRVAMLSETIRRVD